jgi:hypothetical protein
MKALLRARLLVIAGCILFGSVGALAGRAIAAQAATVGGIAIYQPSAVSSKTDDTYVLFHTANSIKDVNAFYVRTLANGGWSVQGHTASSAGASITAKRGDKGVTISIYPAYGGTSVSVSRYPWKKH